MTKAMLVNISAAIYVWPNSFGNHGRTPRVAIGQDLSTVRKSAQTAADYLSNLVFRGLIGLALMLPYRRRVPFLGGVVNRVISPLAGWHKRVRNNLAMVMPDLSEQDVDDLVVQVSDTAGRMLAEMYSGQQFADRARAATLEGPGLEALKTNSEKGRPVILVTGHFGNFVAIRPAMEAIGVNMGVLYRAQTNRFFNAHYVAALEEIGKPLFEEGKRGMVQMVKHLREGGVLGILTDVHVSNAPRLDFLGKPAATSPVTAELALKYNAALIPVYAIRQANGLDFKIFLDDEIPHSTAIEMTKSVNASLEKIVRKHPGQWFWIHRRWK